MENENLLPCRQCGKLTIRKDRFCSQEHRLDYEAFREHQMNHAIT